MLKNYEDAIAAYDKALALDSGSAHAWNQKGRALFNLQRHEAALAAFEKSLGIEPTEAVFWHSVTLDACPAARHFT